MLHRMALAGAMALLLTIAACRTTTITPGQLEIDRIAVVGHGMAFDENMRPIPMDLKTIQSMQGSLRDALGKPPLLGRGDKGFAADAEAAIAAAGRPEERALLTGALINWKLERADRQVREAYGWRNRFLTERTRALLDLREGGRYDPSEALKRLLRSGGRPVAPPPGTDYMHECRAEGVPVPPDFSMTTPGAWIHQGDLTYNMLSPGALASVWTWTDPERAGACVALPRDGGGYGQVAGIICQSALTGKACFWDNLRRGDVTIERIPPATETMVIRELQDGRTLDEDLPCTRCHTGNNVYLMMPDDPTWAKLMRGPLNRPQPVSRPFTTVVNTPPYTPIAWPSWVNAPLGGSCAGSCHIRPNPQVKTLYDALSVPAHPPMPPACATAGGCNATP